MAIYGAIVWVLLGYLVVIIVCALFVVVLHPTVLLFDDGELGVHRAGERAR